MLSPWFPIIMSIGQRLVFIIMDAVNKKCMAMRLDELAVVVIQRANGQLRGL